ncbi:hypothetical protein AAFM48_31950 [Burkholderia pseudomallei]
MVRRGARLARALKAAAAGCGRGDIMVLPGSTTIVGATEADALRRRDELVDLIPLRYGLNRLAGTLGVPVERLAPDRAPLPDDLALPDGGNGNHTFFHATLARARRRGYTARELIRAMAGGGGHRVIAGTPEQIADDIARWSGAGAADGFNLMPDVLPGGLRDFRRRRADPATARAFSHRIRRTTLRDHFGLPRPAKPGACERA